MTRPTPDKGKATRVSDPDPRSLSAVLLGCHYSSSFNLLKRKKKEERVQGIGRISAYAGWNLESAYRSRWLRGSQAPTRVDPRRDQGGNIMKKQTVIGAAEAIRGYAGFAAPLWGRP